MGHVIPPPPLTAEQLEVRYADGARTFAELDPALERWRLGRLRARRFHAACLVVSGTVMLLGLVVAVVGFL